MTDTVSPVGVLRVVARPLTGGPDDYDITRRLIEEQGFTAVAVEADWPDAYRVNRYVRGQGADAGPQQALDDFQRFPRIRASVDPLSWASRRPGGRRSTS